MRTEAEAWRLIHSRYAQNTLTTEMISGSLLHNRADEYNQHLDESKEQKQTEDLAGMQSHHHEQQILLPRSLDEYQTKFLDEHNEVTKIMKDLSIVQHQTDLEEKVGNEQTAVVSTAFDASTSVYVINVTSLMYTVDTSASNEVATGFKVDEKRHPGK